MINERAFAGDLYRFAVSPHITYTLPDSFDFDRSVVEEVLSGLVARAALPGSSNFLSVPCDPASNPQVEVCRFLQASGYFFSFLWR